VSINYYSKNAEAYFADTVQADVHDLRSSFCSRPAGGDILDAGCGSDVMPWLSTEQVIASRHLMGRQNVSHVAPVHGPPVIQMTFQEMRWRSVFDGIWACASLLHVPQVALRDVLGSFVRALRPNGTLYASFKYGTGERVVDGRRFTDMTEVELGQVLRSVGFSSTEFWITDEVRPGKTSQQWLNALARS
jgi:SAM-dependent methyltransferase